EGAGMTSAACVLPAHQPRTNAIASGPVSFANVFNAQTATILQGNRCGANMGVLNVYHPDIEAFITAKSYEAGILNHFNLSVMVDDKFMEAAQERREITLHWPVYDEYGHIEEDPANWKVTKSINAGDLWDSIMRHAYDNGEPGVFFYDNMNQDNNLWYEESIVCSNPCAEYLAGTVFAGDYDASQYGGACNLGSLMLHKFVENPFTENAELNLYKLAQAVHTAVRFLDNIIDINTFPSVIYKNYQQRYRTIGLGYTGLADALVMLGYQYDTQEARRFVSEVTEFIAYSAYSASVELAKEKGAFPGFCREAFTQSGFLEKHRPPSLLDWNYLIENIQTYGIRNAKLLSVAPTGTMSLVYGNNCSSGIEPIFSLEYSRKVKMGGQGEKDVQIVTVHDYAYGLHQKMKADGCEVFENPPFVTALEMSVDDHVKMLAAIAYNVDMSVSKTINVPPDYPYDKCKDIYVECWKSGIKGCTIFRPNEIREGVLLTHDDHVDENSECITALERGEIIRCDDSLVGIKKKLNTGCGSMHLMAWYDPDTRNIMEVFVGRGSSGGCEKNLTAMTRLISAGLRGGIPFDYIVDQLDSCGGCSAYQARRVSKHDTSPGSSCATAIALALTEMQKQVKEGVVDPEWIMPQTVQEKEDSRISAPKCPECGAELSFEGGCNICKSCGWSKCG
ncbi:MAG: adenosylcobalamin-dependent ribonucleoside-diphosphate reductase, partial [Oscillospiraceae bacterium]|nr:adenosylcobalamin-dependent ribonucleoside-diphosphate reductase [Oscillospiraceae bacterium]